ncbi:MAG TPA: LPS-assembly protein LptD [Burkholderiales bacterium]|nr:LPS-assembly protein LptD [Burkholderiales bacterium]
MSFFRSRLAALALALFLPAGTSAQGQNPERQRSIKESRKPGTEAPPVYLDADRIEGVSEKETAAQGNVELRRGNVFIRADSLNYYNENEDVEARGSVRFEREGDIVTGPALKYRMKDATGVFEKPEYSLAPRATPDEKPVPGRGQAEVIEFLGERQFKVKGGFFTTCKPGDDSWLIKADELDLDFTRDVGTARGGTLLFKGVPLIKAPSFDFSLNNQRKSGFLPPSLGTTGKSGPEITVPYYVNLAPNYDLTLEPRYMEKRGSQIGEQFRYLQPHYSGEFTAEVLPHDQLTDSSRSAMTLVHTYNRDGNVLGGLNLNKVSDDNYFRDLSTRISITSQATLPREGYLTYNGDWSEAGGYSATARVQRFQVLQDPANPIVPPYGRTPQLTLSATRPDVVGVDFGALGEFVDFSHPTLVNGKRATIYPSLSLPLITPSAFLTPKFGVHATHYSLDGNAPGTPDQISRSLPIFSVDSGLTFERETELRGQSFTQTLEPRAYYLRIPFRDQNPIPLFDTGIADFNYAQIFSENSFAGGDRINDANQLTLALTSRMVLPSTGQEVLRGTLGQRYYFKDQQVTLNPTDAPRTYSTSDWLAALSARVTPRWTVEAATEYNQRSSLFERLTVSTRYQPEPLKTLNLSYRFLSSDITRAAEVRQVDLSSQWPLGRGWYGVARFNYSLHDSRIVESIGGLEYSADCWIGRLVAQRFAVAVGTSTTAFFLQLELNGLSRIGSNPLEALKRSVPGYQQLNSLSPSGGPDRPFDLHN